MRVTNPGPGELLDRLSILQIKAKAAFKKGDDELARDFVREESEVEAYLVEHFVFMSQGTSAYTKYLRDLAAVNGMIWSCIENAHKFDTCDRLYAQNARQTTRLNDRRAEIIAGINDLAGVGRKEKV